jgi:hypothetical protein
MKTNCTILLAIFFLSATGLCFCQDDFPSPKLVLLGGSGTTNQSGNAHRSLHLGIDLDEPLAGYLGKIPGGYLLELGYAGPIKDFSSGSTIFSANYVGAFSVAKRLMPFFTVGYTRILGTGNALNYGGGIDLVIKNTTRAIRFEVRDYMRMSGSKAKDLAFRIGYVIYAAH